MPRKDPITSFSGNYRFLSNFWPCCVVHDGIGYPSSEHAYQASKSIHFEVREFISNLMSPGEAKKRGKKIELRRDWEDVKELVMFQIVLCKFATNNDIRHKLLATGHVHLEEGNTWGDTYWGTVDGVGENKLGTILMEVRKLLGNR